MMHNSMPASESETHRTEVARVAEHRFVFVAGLHRSGTSLVHRCLKRHPEISGFDNTGVSQDEGQHLQSVFPTARALGGPGRFGFSDQARLTEESQLLTPVNKHRLLVEWSAHWDLSKRCLIEKSPPNLMRSRFLQAVFPTSYFVVIIRHPVATSLATRKWSKGDLSTLIDHWLVCHEAFESDRRHLHRCRLIRYEDFVSESDVNLARIYDFLGITPYSAGEDVYPQVNQRYFDKWRSASNSWLSRRRIANLTDRFEDRVRRFGYSLLDLDSMTPEPSNTSK